MKIQRFNVVELKDKNRATILEIKGKKYLAEIVNPYGITLGIKTVTKDEIQKVIYYKDKIRKQLR